MVLFFHTSLVFLPALFRLFYSLLYFFILYLFTCFPFFFSSSDYNSHNYPLFIMCPFPFPPILPFCLMPLILLTFYFLYPSSSLLIPLFCLIFHFCILQFFFFQGIFIINSAPVLLLSPMYIVLIRDRALFAWVATSCPGFSWHLFMHTYILHAFLLVHW